MGLGSRAQEGGAKNSICVSPSFSSGLVFSVPQ